MSEAVRKHVTSPTEPASDAGFERPDGHLLHAHEVAGSSPAPPTNPHLERGFAFPHQGPRE
jgi:hypothetical protein